MSPSGPSRWANGTLSERVLDLLPDIMFAPEVIRDLVVNEQGFEPFIGSLSG